MASARLHVKLCAVTDQDRLPDLGPPALAGILRQTPNTPAFRHSLAELADRILMEYGPGPYTNDEPAEAERVALVYVVVCAPQESALQTAAFGALMKIIIPMLDRHSRRSYLPSDESDSVAIDALGRVRLKNFENLAKFLADRATHRARTLEGWLRMPCRGEISRRLRRLPVLLPSDESGLTAIDRKERSTTLVPQKLIKLRDAASRKVMLATAEAKLGTGQRRAMEFYFAMRDGTLPEDCCLLECAIWEEQALKLGTQMRVREAYTRIAQELGLIDAAEAERVVKLAKERLKKALKKILSDHEASAIEEGDQ
jgi:hypothetical protein